MAGSDPQKSQSKFPDWVKNIWAPIAGFAGAVILVVQVIQLWRGDQETVTYVTAALGALLVLTGLFWVALSRKVYVLPDFIHPDQTKKKSEWRYQPILRRQAIIALVVCTLGGVGGGYLLYRHRQELAHETVILVATFDGPEDKYGVTNELLEQLNSNMKDYSDIHVISLGQTITIQQGSQYARSIGDRYLSDIVIWGWYRPTENPNITIHLEYLSRSEIDLLGTGKLFKIPSTSVDMESFSVQQKLGQELSALVLFISGYAHYISQDNSGAIKRFNQALSSNEWPDDLINRTNVLYFEGRAYSNIGFVSESQTNLIQAIQGIDQIIELDPTNSKAFLDRARAEYTLDEYQAAITDIDRAISINPQDPASYCTRAFMFYQLDNLDLARTDLMRCTEMKTTDPDTRNLAIHALQAISGP